MFSFISVISDLINYFVFVVIILVIDIVMVVRLRRTLDDKKKRFAVERPTNNKDEKSKKKSDSDEPVKQAIRMVVLNTALSVVFKMPLTLNSLIVMLAEVYLFIYIKNTQYSYSAPTSLNRNFGYYKSFSHVMPDVGDLLYNSVM